MSSSGVRAAGASFKLFSRRGSIGTSRYLPSYIATTLAIVPPGSHCLLCSARKLFYGYFYVKSSRLAGTAPSRAVLLRTAAAIR